MTDQEQRIAIAEACGWSKIGWYEDNAGPGFWHGLPPVKLNADWEIVDQDSKELPDYLTDLNAMHTAEKHLGCFETCGKYVEALEAICEDPICFATARQRAEAFLRTIGKWKD